METDHRNAYWLYVDTGTIKIKLLKGYAVFFGYISYPVYIIHYPIVYILMAWVVNERKSFAEAWPAGLMVLFSSVTLAYVCLRIYDVPVRRWLTRKLFLEKAGG